MAARRRSIAACLGLAWLGWSPSTSAEDRWPSWPTALEHTIGQLLDENDGSANERERALHELSNYATPLITDALVLALDDTSPEVRRQALQLCYRREIPACVPAATGLWSRGLEEGERLAVLRVLALDPTPDRLTILLSVLRDPSEELRAHAAYVLGSARLDTETRDEVRAALLAKLSDSASGVRRQAVESLGLLGPGEGTLAVARLLDDPEPSVQASAAIALGRLADPRAVPALTRAMQSQLEAKVLTSIVEAIASLKGPTVPTTLLAVLDAPPSSLSAMDVASAIGLRHEPEPELIDGLVARLSEPRLVDAALRSLLLIGDTARPHLESALAQGLEPRLEDSVRSLLAAMAERSNLGSESRGMPPNRLDADAQLQTGSVGRRFHAAVRLGESNPIWLGAVVADRIEQTPTLEEVEPWLVAILASKQELQPARGSWRVAMRLLGWAADPELEFAARALAVAMLMILPHASVRGDLLRELDALGSDREPLVRAHVAMVSAGLGPRGVDFTETFLLDVDPLVRTAAALALAGRESSSSARARLEQLAVDDPCPEVRAGARFGRDRAPASAHERSIAIVSTPRYSGSRPERYLPLVRGEERWWAPALTMGTARWAIVLGAADGEVDPTRRSTPDTLSPFED